MMRAIVASAALALLSTMPASAATDIPIGKTFTIAKDSIVCTSSESLFLLFEGAYLANKSGGKPAFDSYFSSAAKSLEEAGTCMLNDKEVSAVIDGINIHTNVTKGKAGQKVYAAFIHPTEKRQVFANAESVPGLLEYITTLAQTKPKN